MVTLYIVHHDRQFGHMDKVAKYTKMDEAVRVRDKLNQKFKPTKSFVIVGDENVMVNPLAEDVEAFVNDYYQ